MHFTRLRLTAALLLFSGPACRESTDSPATALVDGNWQGACLLTTSGSQQRFYTFSEARQVNREERLFADEDCQQALGTVIFRGSYALQITSEPYLYAIDMFFTETLATPSTADAVDLWNGQSLCSRQDWALDQSRDITLLQGEGCRSFSVPRVEYRDVVRVDRDQTLVFASDLNHLATRPLAVGEARLESTFYRK